MMKKMAIFCFGMFGVGFLMAASYFLLVYMSGDPLVTENVFDIQAIKMSKAASQARRNPEQYKPLKVTLSPEMNPIAISCVLKRQKRRGTGEYVLDIYTSDGELFQSIDSRFINRDSGKGLDLISAIHSIERIEVERSDEYELRLSPGEKVTLPIYSMDLRLRKNASEPPLPLLFAGAGFALLGMPAGILFALVANMQKVAEAQARAAKNKSS